MHDAWLDIIKTRDAYYLMAFLLVATGYMVYRFVRFSTWLARLVILVAVVVVALAVGWGALRLFSDLI